MKRIKLLIIAFILISCIVPTVTSCSGFLSKMLNINAEEILNQLQSMYDEQSDIEGKTPEYYDSISELDHTAFDGENAFVVINNNVPFFTKEEKTTKSYEKYGYLDSLGRCTVCMACVGKDLMPTEKREDISSIYPTGWKYNGKSNNKEYDFVDGGWVYNRCHMIGFQLTGENANERNLITGTRFLNIDGMLSFENMIADAVKEQNLHVMYRVTPVFAGDNLVCEGLLLEGYSVEDDGETIEFCVFSFNVQPGVVIDYATGQNKAA